MDWRNLPEILMEHGIHPNVKNFHQYFIVDAQSLSGFVDWANIRPGERIMEIGAGVGNITELLAQQGNNVVAFEIDKRMKVFLGPLSREYKNLLVHFADIKKAKWPRFNCLVANIPFNVLEPILPRLTNSKANRAVLVVGERFRQSVLTPLSIKNVTKFGVMVQSFFHVEELGLIPRDSFYPTPNYDAVVVQLRRTRPNSLFLQVCQTLFRNPKMMVEHVLSRNHLGFQLDNQDSLQGITDKRVDRLTNSDIQKLFMYFQQ